MNSENSHNPWLPTLAAALAVLLSASAFTGVLGDPRWVLPGMLAVAVVAGVGLAGRTLRWWPPLVVLVQFAALLMVLVVLFSDDVFLGVLPGWSALREVTGVLSTGLETIRTGTPPVAADRAIQCLVCLGLGLVAILVDAIAIAAMAPAVAGLVLLCVFAIPASLANSMLPWGSFLTGAVGFALLLVSGGRQYRWGRSATRIGSSFSGHVATVTGTAGVLALLAGTVFTGVGTEGRLPGYDKSASDSGAIGLRPFTSLRGQLNRDEAVKLFRVRGLPEETYLRAMTLRDFDPERGWQLGALSPGTNANGQLPVPKGTDLRGDAEARVEIEPLNYRDPWLPVFGVPREISGMGPHWRYDPKSGIVFTQTQQDSQPYVERMALSKPAPEQLRAAPATAPIDPGYLKVDGVSPRIGELARRITADAPTNFDKAVALNQHFVDPANGFSYELATAPPKGNDALADFLFQGKRGFCEQYASSMAVLLREVGIPSRVAVGFTPGTQEGDHRVITTNDAHAWVEAYFPGSGWVTFDPTPLDDGRRAVPSYQDPPPRPEQQEPAERPDTPEPSPDQPSQPDPPDHAGGAGQHGGGGGIAAGITGAVFALAFLGAAPSALREFRRQRRLRAVASDATGAADIAWREVLDAFHDRGSLPDVTDTVRRAASGLSSAHALDTEGTEALNMLVNAVEWEWYAPEGATEDTDLAHHLRTLLTSLALVSPRTWRQRLLPNSVLRVQRRGTDQHA